MNDSQPSSTRVAEVGTVLIDLEEIQQQRRVIGESADTQPKRYVTVSNPAAYWDLSRDLILRLISFRKLPAHRRVHGCVIVDRQELDDMPNHEFDED